MGTDNLRVADSHALSCLETGGARRDRTADLLHAMQALSQLSYSPTESGTLRVQAWTVNNSNFDPKNNIKNQRVVLMAYQPPLSMIGAH